MKSRFRMLCLLFLFLLSCVPAVKAQEPLAQSYVDIAKGAVASAEKHIPVWKAAATLNFIGAVAVGLLGIVAAALPLIAQAREKAMDKENDKENEKEPAEGPKVITKTDAQPAERRRRRMSRHDLAVIVVGAVISALTLIMNLAFAADHREYSKAIIQAEELITNLKKSIASFQRNPDVMAYSRLENRTNLTPEEAKEMTSLFHTVVELDKKDFGDLVKQVVDLEKNLTAVDLSFKTAVAYASTYLPDLTVSGSAESNNAWQAEQNSYMIAVQKMTAELSSSLKLNEREGNNLQQYIGEYAKAESNQVRASNGRLKFFTRLTLPTSYINPSLVNAFLRAKAPPNLGPLTREQEIQKVRAELAARGQYSDFDGFIESPVTTVSLGGGDVTLRASNARNGDFTFKFAVERQKSSSQATVRLESMVINQDASTGSTRWTFHVLSAGRVIMSLPEQRWDDSKHPTVCWWGPDAGLTGNAAVVGGGVPLAIVGLKPKVK